MSSVLLARAEGSMGYPYQGQSVQDGVAHYEGANNIPLSKTKSDYRVYIISVVAILALAAAFTAIAVISMPLMWLPATVCLVSAVYFSVRAVQVAREES